ncbi:MAG TPA: LuxR C-terminal-related transcriptional regulator [Candidatus Stackebrandtia faecavium]|nr:LuxR C-terminal-related transcriptional regulator [Candidatus Stackebrandtia faecavium]
MPDATTATDPHDGGQPQAATLADEAVCLLKQPGLVIVSGPAGSGRTTTLHKAATRFRGPVYHGGGLSMLRNNHGLALTRAVNAKLPTEDIALTSEAVRSRVRNGLLLLDDAQWCDPVTLKVLPLVAQHCRVLIAVRTPHQLPASVIDAFHENGTWLTVPPLTPQDAAALVRHHAPALADAAVTALVRRGGGNPLVVASLAKQAQKHPDRVPATPTASLPHAVHVLAESIADLPRAARTALAALGLLGRPASRGMLGGGVDALEAAGIVTVTNDIVTVVSTYTAEVAAGLLDGQARTELHRTLAGRVTPLEAARHYHAAADTQAAYDQALAAAEDTNLARRAEALLFAVGLDDPRADETVALHAAHAALAVGRPRSALKALAAYDSVAAQSAVAQAHLYAGHVAQAARTAQQLPVNDIDDPTIRADVDRVRILTHLHTDQAETVVSQVRKRYDATTMPPGTAAAIAAYDATQRAPGWTAALAQAAAECGNAGDSLTARWCAWLLVEYLIADGHLAQAGRTAEAAAHACTADHAYSWQTRFLAAQVWCQVLLGDDLEDATAKASQLLDHALPSVARGYASASASLAEADAGALRNARHRLRAAGAVPPNVATVLKWVGGETAWLDNQPSQAIHIDTDGTSLVAGLGRITAYWAVLDRDGAVAADVPDEQYPLPAQQTLTAWHKAASDSEDVTAFGEAADAWRGVVLREQVRCLLAHGALTDSAEYAVPPLQAAEQLAESSGMTVLAGRVRQALRRHHVRRDERGKRAGDALTQRETQVLAMVANGDPTRRIAGALGITRETVETHIRAGMRKLGAKTRTEAAVLAAKMTAQGR